MRRTRRRHRAWAGVALAAAALAALGFAGWRAGMVWSEQRRERQVERHIAAASERYGVDPALVKAVIWRESRFRPDARGTVGELGLMQVGALAAEDWARNEQMRRFEHGDLLDPERNVMAGAWYLSHLLRRYADTDNPTVFALADYNAGRVRVLRWMRGGSRTNSERFLEAMDYPGTRRYVQAVMERRERYREDFEKAVSRGGDRWQPVENP